MPGPASDTLPVVVLDRHCRCYWRPLEHDGPGHELQVERVTTGCPLHDPDPRHDLPEAFP